jgi:3-methyladenine DNA glycosylase AlkD
MKAHIGGIYNLFDAHRNDVDAQKMTAYMRNKFPHFGIKAKPRRELTKNHNKGFELAEADFLDFAEICFEYPEREIHHYCLDTLHGFRKNFTPQTIKLSEFLITHNSWWDTVDSVNTLISLPIFRVDKSVKEQAVKRWKTAENMWLRRSAIISQLKFRKETDKELLADVIKANLGSEEFFINKAIGWALREYGHYNPEWVLRFANSVKLEPLSYREAVRKLI